MPGGLHKNIIAPSIKACAKFDVVIQNLVKLSSLLSCIVDFPVIDIRHLEGKVLKSLHFFRRMALSICLVSLMIEYKLVEVKTRMKVNEDSERFKSWYKHLESPLLKLSQWLLYSIKKLFNKSLIPMDSRISKDFRSFVNGTKQSLFCSQCFIVYLTLKESLSSILTKNMNRLNHVCFEKMTFGYIRWAEACNLNDSYMNGSYVKNSNCYNSILFISNIVIPVNSRILQSSIRGVNLGAFFNSCFILRGLSIKLQFYLRFILRMLPIQIG